MLALAIGRGRDLRLDLRPDLRPDLVRDLGLDLRGCARDADLRGPPGDGTPACGARAVGGGGRRRRIGPAKAAAAAADRDHAAHRQRPRAHAPAVVARPHDPLAVLLTDDDPDVMLPHHDGADARARRRAPMRPVAREIVARTAISAGPPAPV